MDVDKHPDTSKPINGTIEVSRIVNTHINPVGTSTIPSATRTHSPPLMGTSARAAKRRIDTDAGPIRIEGTDTYNQQLQHHYQNVRQILDNPEPNIDPSDESKQSFSAKRDLFEQRLKTATYDTPPAQKIITTITTTTSTAPSILNRSNSLKKEASQQSVDHLLDHAAELQKRNQNNKTRTDSQQSLVIERTEQYQVFFDSANRETRRTPSLTRTSITPVTKTGYATNLDQAQTDRLNDDHQIIQDLTRALQQHNVTTTANDYKRSPSESNPILVNTITTTTVPSSLLLERSIKPIISDYAVIDALLDNPLGTHDERHNDMLHTRVNAIKSNLRNTDYVNLLKQSIRKNQKKSKKSTKETDESDTTSELVNTQIQPMDSIIESTFISYEQTPLSDSKDKEKSKKKSKQLTKTTDRNIIDSIMSSPICLRLRDAYLAKYKVSSPSSQLSNMPSITTHDNRFPWSEQPNAKVENGVEYDLVKVVNELMLHHTTTSGNRTTTDLRQPDILNGSVRQQQYPVNYSNQSEPVKPRIVYRYLDEQGRVLKLSSVPPSQLHEMGHEQPQQPSQKYPYRNTEPMYFHDRYKTKDEERRHPLPGREERPTWKDESKLATTVTREDLKFQDKRIPPSSKQPTQTTRAVPVSIEHEHPTRTPSQNPQQRTHHDPDQQNIKLNWLPLSHQLEQEYIPGGTASYDTDSTNSDHSATYHQYDLTPKDNHYRHTNQPLLHHGYNPNHSLGPASYPPPPQGPYRSRNISPEYHGGGAGGVSRNYIEIFRGGATKPSEVYSLPLNQAVSPSNQAVSASNHPDQYPTKKYGKKNISSSQKNTPSINSRYEKTIPSSTVHTSSYREPKHPHKAQHSSPNRDYIYFDNYVRQSKSFDYRPLRTKLQREHKITPSLLVDEWDHPQQSISINSNKQTSVSSPDDVFIDNNRTHNKA